METTGGDNEQQDLAGRSNYAHVNKKPSKSGRLNILSNSRTIYQQYLVLCTVCVHKLLNLWITRPNPLNYAGCSAMISSIFRRGYPPNARILSTCCV